MGSLETKQNRRTKLRRGFAGMLVGAGAVLAAAAGQKAVEKLSAVDEYTARKEATYGRAAVAHDKGVAELPDAIQDSDYVTPFKARDTPWREGSTVNPDQLPNTPGEIIVGKLADDTTVEKLGELLNETPDAYADQIGAAKSHFTTAGQLLRRGEELSNEARETHLVGGVAAVGAAAGVFLSFGAAGYLGLTHRRDNETYLVPQATAVGGPPPGTPHGQSGAAGTHRESAKPEPPKH